MKSTELSKGLLKKIIEGILFLSDKPVKLEEIVSNLNVSQKIVKEVLEELKNEYFGSYRGIRITEVAGGFRMETVPEISEMLERFFSMQNKKKLSRSCLEVLAIIAYKGPVTKKDIEIIRGIGCDGAIKRLLELELIKIAGKKKAPGKPFLFKTTDKFLEYFGLKSLEDLPPLKGEVSDALKEIAPANR